MRVANSGFIKSTDGAAEAAGLDDGLAEGETPGKDEGDWTGSDTGIADGGGVGTGSGAGVSDGLAALKAPPLIKSSILIIAGEGAEAGEDSGGGEGDDTTEVMLDVSAEVMDEP